MITNKVGFFPNGGKAQKNSAEYSLELLHTRQCTVCPLSNNHKILKHPDMPATGSNKPIVYILAEAPGAEEDKTGTQMIGPAGQVLRFRIAKNWLPYIRWNNCVRTRPPKNREPTPTEIECCRPSIRRDIEQTKPEAIFGFGNVALRWALGVTGIMNWRGRRVPVTIGSHTCWFYPMLHPSYVLRTRRFEPDSPDEFGCQEEFAFACDLKRAFQELDQQQFPAACVHSKEAAISNIEIATGDGEDDFKRVKQVLDLAAQESSCGVDYETNCLRPYTADAKILSIAVAVRGLAFAFAVDHKQAGWTPEQKQEIKKLWTKFLLRAPCRKIAHHLNFEMEWSAKLFGTETLRAQPWDDTEAQAYILDERQGCLSLEFLGLQHFGINLKAINNLDRKNLDKHALSDVLQYNALDAKYHRLLYLKQRHELRAHKLEAVYQEQLRRVPCMVLSQIKGVPIDQDMVESLFNVYDQNLTELSAEIAEVPEAKQFAKLKDHPLRPSSPQDVGFLLQTIFQRRDLTGATAETIGKVDHPLCKLILDWKHNNKLRSTYVMPVRKGSPHLYPDQRLHPTYNICSTRTNRTSSSDPSIQNWPTRETNDVRAQVRPGPNERVVSFDYGQIQARNIAMESLDQALIKSFWDRSDIHSDWMERIEREQPGWIRIGPKDDKKDVLDNFRNKAKSRFVFPSFFGAQPKKIASGLDIPIERAERLQQDLWTMFPDIHAWQNDIIANYYELGYVDGLSGFRRRAPIDMNELINAPIQADEALIVCDAMIRLSEYDHDHLQAVLEIHDDLTFIMPKKQVDELSEIIIEEMLTVPFEWAHVVPITVEMKVGDNWADLDKVGSYSSDDWKGGTIAKERRKA
jgi:uracil-DNA glycosylase family 4